MNYEMLKKEYLEKLHSVQNTFKNIEKYKPMGLFEEKNLESLTKIDKKNSFYLDKLKKGEIEVAIVGMENTGKSTFANALIQLPEAFPTGSIRTTFTSTRLKYGPKDRAVVEFFKRDEFNSMFREMLEKVEYPNYETADYETLDIQGYKEYFEKLKVNSEAIYKAYNSTVNKDIQSILSGKSEIHEYLGQSEKKFTKDDIKNEELKKFITDKYIARTVKKVELELSTFEDTKELVIYDVPGFNSITEKHKLETKKSLDKSDVIILIKNVIENSEITSEEQSILNSYDEDNGLPLSEKLFVFGTKVDRANSKEEANINIKQLISDLKSNLSVEKNRIYIGSPFAYMQQLGFEDGRKSVDILNSWGMSKYITSTEELKNGIKDFYKQEAFDNIQKQINKNIESLKSILSTVIYEHEDNKKLEQLNKADRGKLLHFADEVQIDLARNLHELNASLKKDINDKKYFSSKLKEKIDVLVWDVTMEELERFNKEVGVDIRNEFATNKVNTAYREHLLPKIKNNFESLVVKLANEKYKEYFDKTIAILLQSMKVSQDNIHHAEIKKKLEIYVEELTKTISYKDTSYVYLLQRFSRDLLSVVIGAEVGSVTRKERFKEAKKEFQSLAMYYEDIDRTIGIYDLKLIKKILNLSQEDKGNTIQTMLHKEFSDLYKFDDFSTFIAKTVIVNNIPVLIAIDAIKTAQSKFKNISSDNISILINKAKETINKNNSSSEVNENDKKLDAELDKIFEKVKPASSKEELLKELNNDIECFKDILKTAVIEATGLELPFITSLVDQNKKIIDSTSKIKEFIAQNYAKINYKDLGEIQNKKVLLEEKKRVIADLKKLILKI